ncbi:sterigmatocystin 8-o-methyltransferase [Phlyctema vagabunda]|uniref:Sterigmatocystin 8-o-methyltransferase n=1 Tax=Phlyctema vagabunda TaxID=108571 RepID=A0ABR4PSR9_9HELO
MRMDALDSLLELRDLLSTPREVLQYHCETDFVSRHALDAFGIYSLVPLGKTRTYDEIASQTRPRLPTKTVRRLLRHAITQRIFCEVQPRRVAHTSVSWLLAEDVTIRDYYGLKSQDVWPAATRIVDALIKWPCATGPMHTGYVLVHGQPRQQILAQDPARNMKYDHAMRVVDGYDWAALGKATVVDVGGGMGTVSQSLAKAFPLLDLIVQDKPAVIARARTKAGPEISLDADARSRVHFMEHDFFTHQPVQDADVYLFRRVFMEWEDERAMQIIRALIPALKRGSQILIVDFYVPTPGTCPLSQERRFRATDMTAMAVANGAQRELDEWQSLVEAVDPGFRFRFVRPIPISEVVFVEVEW